MPAASSESEAIKESNPAILADDGLDDEGLSQDSIDRNGLEYGGLPRQKHFKTPFLYPGAVFKGNQQTDNQTHQVTMEIKSIDLERAVLCGHLAIAKLTADIPVLTTFFEGEIISPFYSFITRHPEWGATRHVDMMHWRRFPAFSKRIEREEFHYEDWLQEEHLFMRWKERFLVPDYETREVQGASFSGFYYICFDQSSGDISGFYYQQDHGMNQRFQSIALEHQGKGIPEIEFR